MRKSIFLSDGARFTPTELARGPWDPGSLHGGAPAALITAAFERTEPGSGLRIGRLGFEFLRPIPLAPLTLSINILRAGRRVQELAGELRADDELIARASALRVQEVPAGLPHPGAAPPRAGAVQVDAPLPRPSRDGRFASRSTDRSRRGLAQRRWRCAG